MISALIIGLVIGAAFMALRVVWSSMTGTGTAVTASGIPTAPLTGLAWGLVIGSIVALLEVLNGRKLTNTWGLSLIISSVGAAAGGLATWKLWTLVSTPATPPPPGGVVLDAKKGG